MESVIRKVGLYFDPQRQGYDSAFWSTLTGVPFLNGSNNIEFNAATAVGTSDITSGEVTFSLKIPTVPTAGQTREWGLVELNSSAAIKFRIIGTAFTAYVSDIDGNTNSSTLTWDSSYTGATTKFKIEFSAGNVNFYINGIKQDVEYGTGAPNAPMSVYVKNLQADTMELTHLQIRFADLFAGKELMSGVGGGGGGGLPGPSTEQDPYTPYQNISFNTANVKASAGHVYSFLVTNTTAGTVYFQLHDTATTPASGDSADFMISIPGLGTTGIGTDILGPVGRYLSSGIAVANSSTLSTYTAGTPGDLVLNLFYDGALTTTYLLLENGGEMLLENGDIMLQE